MRALHHSPTLSYANVFPLKSLEWDDLRVAANNVKVPATKGPAWTVYKASIVLAFSDQAVEANEERVYFVIQLPHGYKEGTNLRPHVHWAGEDNTAGDVVWKLSYSWANMLGTFPPETSILLAASNSLVTDYHNYAQLPEITGTGQEISSIVLCSLRRNSNNVLDTYCAKLAYLLEFDIHYQKDTLGSKEELSKY